MKMKSWCVEIKDIEQIGMIYLTLLIRPAVNCRNLKLISRKTFVYLYVLREGCKIQEISELEYSKYFLNLPI